MNENLTKEQSNRIRELSNELRTVREKSLVKYTTVNELHRIANEIKEIQRKVHLNE